MVPVYRTEYTPTPHGFKDIRDMSWQIRVLWIGPFSESSAALIEKDGGCPGFRDGYFSSLYEVLLDPSTASQFMRYTSNLINLLQLQ
jgi:hypothetical protein